MSKSVYSPDQRRVSMHYANSIHIFKSCASCKAIKWRRWLIPFNYMNSTYHFYNKINWVACFSVNISDLYSRFACFDSGHRTSRIVSAFSYYFHLSVEILLWNMAPPLPFPSLQLIKLDAHHPASFWNVWFCAYRVWTRTGKRRTSLRDGTEHCASEFLYLN